MTTRTAAAAGALAASTWIVTALLVPARVLPDRATPASNALDLVANVLLLIGLAGFAPVHTGQWTGWPRFAPLLCGFVPFAVELPGFIAFGDSLALNYFI